MSSKVIVTIFGASGDLAKRKLYPSLFIPSLARYEETSFHKLNSNIIFRKIKKSNTR